MSKKPTTILAIETSCDETGVAVVQQRQDTVHVLADALASQTDVHAATGGVIPEAAAREHTAVIKPLIEKTLAESGVTSTSRKSNVKGQVSSVATAIDAIAVTVGPGLQPALSVGVTAAQTLAFAWNKPIVPVHHLEGHIYSALFSRESSTNYQLQTTNWPLLALIVSGGHTMLVSMNGHMQYELLGTTRDDAAGEAFDKVARMLGLPYPGGPAISLHAAKGNPAAFPFTRPMLQSGDLDFSFSGLKTEVLYKLRELGDDKLTSTLVSDVAASFEQAVVDALVAKTKQAIHATSPSTVLLAGGVAANHRLRQDAQAMTDQENVTLRIAPPELCGDNAVMIGLAATQAHTNGRRVPWQKIDAQARIPLDQFSATEPAG